MLILKRGRIIVIIKKEEKATLKTNDIKVKSFKVWSTLVCIFSYVEEEELKLKTSSINTLL